MKAPKKIGFAIIAIAVMIAMSGCPGTTDNGIENEEKSYRIVEDIKAVITSESAVLSWTKPAENWFGVRIGISPEVEGWDCEAIYKDETSVLVSGLAAETQYTFTLTTVDEDGNDTDKFTSLELTTPKAAEPIVKEVEKEVEKPADKTPAGKVTSLVATAGDSTVSLSWKNPDDEDLYGVEVTVSDGGNSRSFIVEKTSETYTVYGLKNGKEYTFTIKSFDTSGNMSAGVSASATTKSQVSGITIEYERQSDIGELEHSVSGNKITFIAPEGYETYKWRLDDNFLESNKETPNKIEIKRETLSGGIHSIIVIANGMYSASCTITVKDGESLSDKSVGKTQ